jgi:hypothetical protein
MGAAFSEDAIDTGFDFRMGTLENSATGTASLRYLPTLNDPTRTKEIEVKKRLVDLFFEITKPAIGIAKSENTLTSVATVNDRIGDLSSSPQFQITETAERFIGHQKKSVKYKKEIFMVAERISGFLGKERIDAEVSIDLFTDPEYSTWVEPKVRIEVGKEQLQRAYEVFDELLAFSFMGISQKTLERLTVTIDHRQ